MTGGAFEDGPSDVVPFSRWRALLARSRSARRRAEALLADPGAPLAVRRLPAEDLFFLVRSLGLDDAGELLGLATPGQLRTCADLDFWRRDRLDADRIVEWMETVEALGPARLATVASALDVEVIAFLVRRHAVVYDRTLDEAPPADTRHAVVETPDGFYWLEFTSPDRRVTTLLARLLAHLYNARADLAMGIVREARWSTAAELEESAYQFRSRRVADLGFADPYEALGIYQPIDVDRLVAEPGARGDAAVPPVLPVVFAEALADDVFLARVLARVEDADAVGHIAGAIVMLLNRVLAADLVDPGDVEAVLEASSRARDTVSLGLEHVAGGALDAALRTLESVGPTTLFRVGYTLTHRLGARARVLRARGVDDPDLLPLLEPRPRFPCALDVPPTAGARPFRTRADVDRMERRLQELEHEAGVQGS